MFHALKRITIVALLSCGFSTITRGQSAQPVTLSETNQVYILDNGIVTAQVAKVSGDLVSLKYKDLEMLATIKDENGNPDFKADPPGQNDRGFGPFTDHQYGFWSHDAMGPRDGHDATPTITIDPKTNGGERGEVSIKGISNGRKMGTGPGTNAQGNFIANVEIRYALGRGDSGVYTYCTFDHKPEYPFTGITEARFCVKLNSFFDWMSVAQDEHHNKLYPASLREGDKYIYTTNQFENRAFGWSSTTKNVGLFIVNPSMEYMSGGPTKIEFLGHRDTNQVAAPCVLDYWRSSHYGGAELAVNAGEHWVKTIGPFLLYVNSGADSQAIYADARNQAVKEAAKWPFGWVTSPDYPTPAQRTTVSGQLVLTDPQAATTKLPNLLVGLAAPAYSSMGETGRMQHTIDWQQDAKHYEFWVHGNEDGSFQISGVRPGTYTMHAFADGVLGEYTQADINVEPGKPVDFGKITWTPVRHGKQVWEIGIPNRSGKEFFKGDVYWQPNITSTYAELFPNDITYTIGKSDFTKDWFFAHVPHLDATIQPPPRQGRGAFGARGPTTGRASFARGPASGPAFGRRPTTGGAFARRGGPTSGPARGGFAGAFGGAAAYGRAAPRTIAFDMPAAAHGTATLRIAFCGTGANSLDITVNDKPAGELTNLPQDGGVLSNHGMQGVWHEKSIAFDASLLQKSANRLTLIVPQGGVNDGFIYDYLRLELDESASPTAMAQ